MSLDLEAKIDRDEPWQLRLNDSRLVIENPLQFFVSSLQAYSYCNYRPFSVNENTDRKWFTFIPNLNCLSSIENVFEISAFNQIGLSGIRIRSIKLLAESRNRKFQPGLFIKRTQRCSELEAQCVSKAHIHDKFYYKMLQHLEHNLALDNIPFSVRNSAAILRGSFQAVDHIQKLSPGYYLEYPDQGESAQILKLQQAAYLNIRFQLKLSLTSPLSESTKIIAVLRMRLLERFHLGSDLIIRFHLGPENCPYVGEAGYKELHIKSPNYYFASKYPNGEWFEWELCTLDLDEYLIWTAEPVRELVYSCHIKCQNDRSWKSGIEFSNIRLYSMCCSARGSVRSSR